MLIAWLLASPVMRALDPSALFMLRPMSALLILVTALALAGCASSWNSRAASILCLLGALLAAMLMGESILNYDRGIELLISPALDSDGAAS
ncbi:MAG TPA: hypothetical protein VHE37_16035, partial [Nevskiaceae bacterium]|nr:hypothetical protein [Nevskiaceae bacterium]